MSEFRNLDPEPFGQLLWRLLPDAIGFSVCDQAGLRRWSSDGSDLDRCVRAVAVLNKHHEGWATADTFRCVHDDSLVALSVRIDADDAAMGTMLVLLPAGAAIDAARDSLRAVAQCMVSQGMCLEELDGMAEELAVRYEELNLIYVTEDNIKYFDEGQDALRKLVQNTARYLDTDLTALVMGDRNIITSQGNRTVPLPDAERIIALATGDLYERLRFMKDTVVINDPSAEEVGHADRQ